MQARVAAPPEAAGVTPPRPAAVLVHGVAVSSAYFVPLLERLGRTRPTWAPDLPGHGRTPRLGRGPLDLDQLVQQLEAWCDAIGGLRGATFVGNSLGAQVVGELACRRPDLVGSLALLGPTTEQRARSTPRQALRLAMDASREPPGLLALELVEYLRARPDLVLREFRSGRDHDLAATLARTSQPLLLSRGERDPIATSTWLEELHGARPDATLAVIPAAAHAAHWSHAGAVAALLEAWS